MKKAFFISASIILACLIGATAHPKPTAYNLDRIETTDDGRQIAVIECVFSNDTYDMINVDIGKTNIHSINGTFENTFEDEGETLYTFVSLDNSLWWIVSEYDLDHAPDFSKAYTLTYYDKGTTSCGHNECECYLYDDILLDIDPITA